jgi:hypothetical protein
MGQCCICLSDELKIVRLNVGGQYFDTTPRTLMRAKGSRLATIVHLVSQGHDGDVPHDVNGRIFFDRDPTHFRHILNWLRNATLPDKSIRKELLPEARFYGLNALATWCGGKSAIVTAREAPSKLIESGYPAPAGWRPKRPRKKTVKTESSPVTVT